jgi:hypothetical protein
MIRLILPLVAVRAGCVTTPVTARRYRAAEGVGSMALIVEMWWGRPHEIVVQDVDEHGELYVREVIPNGPPDPERRTFSCHADNWKHAQALAKQFGWQPKGPLLHPWRAKDAAPVRQETYEPDGWIRGLHEVEADDARAWGAALTACAAAVEEGRFELPEVHSVVLIRDDMTANEFREANRGLTVQFLRAFAGFMAKGAFKFGWDS